MVMAQNEQQRKYMNILILTDKNRWFESYLDNFLKEVKERVDRNITLDVSNNHNEIDKSYDICFLLSYSRIVKPDFLEKQRNNIVIHASDLPNGKGMSPLTWQVLEGRDSIIFSLFEAVPELDAGDIYIKKELKLNGTELVDELRDLQVQMTLDLVIEYINNYETIVPTPQEGDGFQYNKRGPKDSELDLNKTLDEQFNLLRVCDNEAYPAFFIKNGVKYIIKISKEI